MIKNYKEKVIQSVNDEFEAFKKKILQQPKEQIFLECFQIYFKSEIRDYLETDDNELPNKHYVCLDKDHGNILSCLWNHYIETEFAAVGNWEEIKDLIADYNELYYSDVLANEAEI